MKKILLATTVLVGTAGFAAAEVSLSGSAAMGVVSNPNSDNKKPQLSSTASINFGAALETDSGLSL
ncbi:MAG: porin, partial [Rhodobacteraceae bacterium]|nr:porin [Paracoccaceae bacterium]